MEINYSDEVTVQDSKGQINATVEIWLGRILSRKCAQYVRRKRKAVSMLI